MTVAAKTRDSDEGLHGPTDGGRASSGRWRSRRTICARRGLGADRVRRDARALRGVGAGGRAAVPAQQRTRLGDGRVRDAAALDAHALRSRGGARQGRRTHAGDPAPDRPQPPRASIDMTRSASAPSGSTATCIEADGGTRTASITGALRRARARGRSSCSERACSRASPLVDHVAAISVGMVDRKLCLDLAYEEDSKAEVDMNVVMTGKGKFIEVQGTAEGKPFTADAARRHDCARDRGHRNAGRVAEKGARRELGGA